MNEIDFFTYSNTHYEREYEHQSNGDGWNDDRMDAKKKPAIAGILSMERNYSSVGVSPLFDSLVFGSFGVLAFSTFMVILSSALA